jgi:hypothetical protein
VRRAKSRHSRCFFVFADTVTTGSYRHPGPGRGWLGIRFQTRPARRTSEVIVHAHLRDSTAERQQEALGVLGVNLIHAAFYRRKDPADLTPADYYRGNPAERYAARRTKLAEARHQRKEKNLELAAEDVIVPREVVASN